MNSSIIVYRLYDVADEINLELVEALWTSRNKIASRLRLQKISPRSITFKDPPVLVELGSHEMTFAGHEYLADIRARIFDIGVVSLIMRLELPDGMSYEEYEDLSIAIGNLPEDIIREYVDAALETIKPACSNMRISEYDEDFTVYYFQDYLPDWDYVPILLKDPNPVSPETHEETLANRFSYSPNDIAYLTWDSAVIFDKAGSMDLPDLLEFANAQFLELRYYDNALNGTIDHFYDEIDVLNKSQETRKVPTYRAVRNKLMEQMADMSVLTSNIDNALQLTEDVFYARIYARYMFLLRASDWRENISNKLNVIQRCYTLLNEEVTLHRFATLGYTIAGILGAIVIVLLINLLR